MNWNSQHRTEALSQKACIWPLTPKQGLLGLREKRPPNILPSLSSEHKQTTNHSRTQGKLSDHCQFYDDLNQQVWKPQPGLREDAKVKGWWAIIWLPLIHPQEDICTSSITHTWNRKQKILTLQFRDKWILNDILCLISVIWIMWNFVSTWLLYRAELFL